MLKLASEMVDVVGMLVIPALGRLQSEDPESWLVWAMEGK